MISTISVLVLTSVLSQGVGERPGPLSSDDIEKAIGQLAVMDLNAYFKAILDLERAGARAVPRLIPLLKNEKLPAQVRLGALRALQGMGPAALGALAPLQELLESKDPMYRWHSLNVIGTIGIPAEKALPKVRALWKDVDDKVRGLAFHVAGRLSEDRKSLLPHLRTALDDKPAVRVAVLELLSVVWGKDAAPLLDKVIEQLAFGDRQVVRMASAALVSMGAIARPRLMEIARKPDNGLQLRMDAVDALSRLRPVTDRQIQTLVGIVRDEHPKKNLRDTARNALRTIGKPCVEELSKLLALAPENKELALEIIDDLGTIGTAAASQWEKIAVFVKHEDADFRVAALKAFVDMPVPPALSVITEALDDESPAAVGQAILAISRLGTVARPALPKLVAILDRGPPEQGQRIVDAFKILGAAGKPAASALLALLGDDRATVRNRAVQSLTAIGPDVLPEVLEMLAKTDEARERRGAMQVVGGLGATSPEAVRLLTELLPNGEPLVRRDAALALGRIGRAAAGATEKLYGLLSDADRDVRIAALTALKSVGRDDEHVVARIAKLTKDRQQVVQWAAIEALAWEGNKRGVTVLRRLLDHEDEFTRLKAVQALGVIGKDAREAVQRLRELRREDRSTYVAAAAEEALEKIIGTRQ